MLSGRVLPAHPKSLPDELLSSWLVRIAEANAIKLHTLTRLVLKGVPNPWIRDIDRQRRNGLWRRLGTLTGTSFRDVRRTTLASFEGHIFPKLHLSGQMRWVLPLKPRSSRRFGFGLQFCPQCLATDDQPYFRRRWRLGFVMFCPDHNAMLHDACPACGATIAVHRRDFGREINEALPLSMCNECGADLAGGSSVTPDVYDESTFRLYARLLKGLKWPKARTRSKSLEHLAVLHQLCKIIVSSRNHGALEQHICDQLGIDPQVETRGRLPFEQRRIGERYFAVSLAFWLMGDLRTRLAEAWSTKAVLFNSLLKDFRDCPGWFTKIAREFNRISSTKLTGYKREEGMVRVL